MSVLSIEQINNEFMKLSPSMYIMYSAELGQAQYDIIKRIWDSKIKSSVAISEIKKLENNFTAMQAVYYSLMIISRANSNRYFTKIVNLDSLWAGIGDWEY